jgi:hypothetical protein
MPPTGHHQSAIVSFLTGRGRDLAGRTLNDVLQMDNTDLEVIHDYIQWLFPLPTRSAAVPGSPVLRADDIAQIRNDPVALNKLRCAIDRMHAFYESGWTWLVAHDHNHLRITPILRSVQLLFGQDEAEDFFHFIMTRVVAAGRPVSPENIKHWRKALDVR